MRQSLQLPMLVKSENLIRGRDKFAIYRQHEEQRQRVQRILDDKIARPPEVVSGESNRYVVTLCRISAGFLDSEDNLTGAFKHVKDAVARWLGFRNDNDERLRWVYQQQECPKKWHAIRITIDDEAEGDERATVVGENPSFLGEITEGCTRSSARGNGIPGRPGTKRGRTRDGGTAHPERNGSAARDRGASQATLAFRRVFVAYPWDLQEGAAPDDIIATELREYAAVERPPEQLQVRIPARHVDRMLRRFGQGVRGLGPGAGPRLIFERHEHEDPAMGGLCWLYMPVEYDEATKT
jgi:hypothetical protein